MSAPDPDGSHSYTARLTWRGNLGDGTSSYTSYSRTFGVAVEGKPELALTADPAFRGDPGLHNPEDLFLASLAGCHMLFFLSLCARHGIRVLAYEDEAGGRMVQDRDGGGRFTQVTLNPVVTIAGDGDEALALRLHDTAHRRCFIANSCSVPIRHHATIVTASATPANADGGGS